ncbi:MAG: hypothetical protein M3680_18650 [Myxococcota bacterium]|nr:hypothetical protein [Myxococcota bacterium]
MQTATSTDVTVPSLRKRATILGIALASVVSGAACKSESRPASSTGTGAPAGSAGSAGSAASSSGHAGHGHGDDAAPSVTPEAAQLPGALWFVGSRLARVTGGELAADFADVGAPVYPSRWALPDGRLVGIASRGDGEPGSEQLVLIGPASEVTRVGPSITQVREPAVDPAGAWIVYEAKLEGHSELYRLDLATSKVMRLTTNPQGNFKPAVLGKDSIVFVSSRDGDSEIYRARVTGKDVRRLTAFHRDDWDPTPSPDGKTIAFVSDREGRPRIFLMDADGTHQRRLTGRAEGVLDEVAPVWSPDGKRLAYLLEGPGHAQLWIREVAGTEDRAMTPAGARDADATFSPDGAWIAVARATKSEHTEIWALPVAGGQAVRVADGRLPRWR